MERKLILFGGAIWPIFNYFYQQRPVDRSWYREKPCQPQLVPRWRVMAPYSVLAMGLAVVTLVATTVIAWRRRRSRSMPIILQSPYDKWQRWAKTRLRTRYDE